MTRKESGSRVVPRRRCLDAMRECVCAKLILPHVLSTYILYSI